MFPRLIEKNFDFGLLDGKGPTSKKFNQFVFEHEKQRSLFAFVEDNVAIGSEVVQALDNSDD